jgi:hypothetical protein
MLSDISDTQLQLDEEYQLSSEQILMENQMILKSLNEIKRKLEDFDARLTYFEQQQQQQQQQQKHMTFTSSQKDLADYNLEEKTNSDIVLEKSIKKENQRSTCFSCRWEKKTCTLYFEDLYDFDKREINSDIGADSNRFTCRCGHLIRIHEYRTSNSSQINSIDY